MKHPNCFVPAPVPVSSSKKHCGFQGTTIPVRPLFRRRVPALRVVPTASTGGWQDAVFGPSSASDSHHPSLSAINAAFPSKWGELFVLGMCTGSKHVYATMQTKPSSRGIRSSAAPSSQALRLALSCSSERLIVADVFEALYCTPAPAGSDLFPNSTAFARDLLPTGLTRMLGLDTIAVAEAGATILRDREEDIPLNRATVLMDLFRILHVRLVAASVEEVTSIGSGVQVRGFMFVEREAAQLYGETVYHNGTERVACDPCTAMAIANAAQVPCYIRRELFDSASMPVRDIQNLFEARGAEAVQARWAEEGQGESCPFPRWEEDIVKQAPKPWELRANDVLAMGNEMLRNVLTRCGVGTTSEEGRESLLRKVIEWMDEVERREVGIRLAAESEMYGLAGELQRRRSKRGHLLQEMREAEEDGRWKDAVRLSQEIRRVESQTADITSEPGSYSRYLDQDDWYKPSR